MLDKEDTWVAYCDDCQESVYTNEDHFDSALHEVKSLGWRVYKKYGEWNHQCTKCQAEEEYKDFDVV